MNLAAAPTPVLRALRAEIAPAWANDAQRAFFWSHAPELLYSGAMGAGKSRILCEKAWDCAMRHPGTTVGIFRKVAASLPATTMRTFFRDVARPESIAARNRSEGWVELVNGSRIYFLGLDPDPITGVPSKVGSLDLGFAFVDEAVECAEADWTMLLGRLRDPRTPWHQLAAATNPGPPDHWLKRHFTPSTPERVYLHATPFDNRFAPPDYLESLRRQDSGNAVSRRLIHGEWSAAEGVIWTLEDGFIAAPEAIEFKSVKAGVDWGFVHAFACEVIGQSGSGRLAVFREVYVKGALLRDIIPALLAIQADYPGITFYADPSEPAYIAECKGAGLHMVAANNEVNVGIQAVAVALANAMTISPDCAGLLSEIPGYTWAPSRLGGFHEKPVEVNDDACDALRYAVMAFERSANVWDRLANAGGVA